MRDPVSVLRYTQSKRQGRTTEMYSEHLIKRKLRMERAESQKGRHLKIATIQNG